MKQAYPKVALARICRLFGLSRQAYYQHGWNLIDTTTEAMLVLHLVSNIRKEQPKVGTRKLYHLLQPDLSMHQIKMGRDALFDLLSSQGMLIRRRKSRPKTTFSNHWFRKYEDLSIGLKPYSPNQLWVADITYIQLVERFAYLSLLTDVYSHKVVGYYLSENLSAYGPGMALEMALKQLPNTHNLIHHSDRGIQYCSHEYVKILRDNQISISMTQSGSPYENATAERLNGILKHELLQDIYSCVEEAESDVKRAILVYNEKRPHRVVEC